MKTPKKIDCIFCFEEKEPSAEHVMPRTLGGNLTIHCVCGDCNRSLSPLDQSLAESSILTMNRMAEQPNAYFSARMPTDSGVSEVKVGYKFKVEIKTQLSFEKDGEKYRIIGSGGTLEEYRDFFKVLRKQIAKKGIQSIRSLAAIESEENEVGFKLFRNRTSEIAFRPSAKDADASSEYQNMVNLLEKRLDEIEETILKSTVAQHVVIDKPGILFQFTPNFGMNFRACAKIAYTFLAHLFGPSFVMGNEFDGLRRYILTGEGADDVGALWLGAEDRNNALRPSRYVSWLPGFLEYLKMKLSRYETHIVYLLPIADRVWVILEFYGQHNFAVDIGSPDIGTELPIFYEFDFVSRTHREIPFMEIAERVVRSRNG